ncbi:MAG: diacylglycerol kinase family protein [Candidatus Caenarcaniphilales bacterium]|nr:diacylglycerol kinase family protein [Candidatus Caenarcaniphilales bacterium]
MFGSFRYAWRGLNNALIREQNFRLEVFALLLVMLAGMIFRVMLWEWVWIWISCFMILVTELINTAIERLTDLIVDKRKTGLAAQAKDIAAAGVLLAVFQSLVAGGFVFLPRLWGLLVH